MNYRSRRTNQVFAKVCQLLPSGNNILELNRGARQLTGDEGSYLW